MYVLKRQNIPCGALVVVIFMTVNGSTFCASAKRLNMWREHHPLTQENVHQGQSIRCGASIVCILVIDRTSVRFGGSAEPPNRTFGSRTEPEGWPNRTEPLLLYFIRFFNFSRFSTDLDVFSDSKHFFRATFCSQMLGSRAIGRQSSYESVNILMPFRALSDDDVRCCLKAI